MNLQETNCHGLHTILQPGTVMHSELSKISFENATRSVGPCNGLCRVENVIERRVEQELDSGKVNSIYSRNYSIFEPKPKFLDSSRFSAIHHHLNTEHDCLHCFMERTKDRSGEIFQGILLSRAVAVESAPQLSTACVGQERH